MRVILLAGCFFTLLFGGCSRGSNQEGASAGATATSVAQPQASKYNHRCVGESLVNPCELYNVSLVELIARPEMYDGKRVMVRGFVSSHPEASAIYISRDDAEYGNFKNGVWLDPSPDFLQEGVMCQWNDSYALVTGSFSAEEGGHMGQWSGAISKISRIVANKGSTNPSSSCLAR